MIEGINWISFVYGVCVGVVPSVIGLMLAAMVDTYRKERKKQ